MDHRVGFGTDLHRLAPGRPLVLGGVHLPEAAAGAVGHSDGDALLHAVTDALFGALAEGDIGEHFPDTAEENRDRDSTEFLAAAMARVRARGWRVANLDAVVDLERPRLGPQKRAMRARIAALCGCTEAQVGVKAKTGEGLDAVGRGEAVAAQAVVLLERQGR